MGVLGCSGGEKYYKKGTVCLHPGGGGLHHILSTGKAPASDLQQFTHTLMAVQGARCRPAHKEQFWGSVSCLWTLRHADQGNWPSDLPENKTPALPPEPQPPAAMNKDMLWRIQAKREIAGFLGSKTRINVIYDIQERIPYYTHVVLKHYQQHCIMMLFRLPLLTLRHLV